MLPLFLPCSILIVAVLALMGSCELGQPRSAGGQSTGNLAEMERLEHQADDLAAQGDPEGAALVIGKAAMMADILLQDFSQKPQQQIYQAAALSYRGQEHGLRAFALFERTGGNPPALSGVCHLLIQGLRKLREAKALVGPPLPEMGDALMKRKARFLEKNEEWRKLFRGLHQDFQCQNSAEGS